MTTTPAAHELWRLLHNGKSPDGLWDAESERYYQQVAGMFLASQSDHHCCLPDALLDDDAISPMAKMAYWYLKRHGGRTGASELASALRLDGHPHAWLLIAELTAAGWLDAPSADTHKSVVFTVHEVAVTVR